MSKRVSKPFTREYKPTHDSSIAPSFTSQRAVGVMAVAGAGVAVTGDCLFTAAGTKPWDTCLTNAPAADRCGEGLVAPGK